MKTISNSNYTRVRRQLEKLSKLVCRDYFVVFLHLNGTYTFKMNPAFALDYFKNNSLSISRVYFGVK